MGAFNEVKCAKNPTVPRRWWVPGECSTSPPLCPTWTSFTTGVALRAPFCPRDSHLTVTRWPPKGDPAPNEVPSPMSGKWAPRLGHRHRNPGNRALGSPPHCLTPFVPPPVHQLKPKSPIECPSLFLIQPARYIPSFQSHLFGSRTEETSCLARAAWWSAGAFLPFAQDAAKTPGGKISSPFPAVFWMRINPKL